MGTNSNQFPVQFYNPTYSNVGVSPPHSDTEIETLADLFIQSAKWSELCQLLLNHAAMLLYAGRCSKLLHWIELIPKTEKNDPLLMYWAGLAGLPHAPQKSVIWFANAHQHFGSDRLGRVICATGVLTAMHHANDFNEAIIWFDELESLDTFVIEQNDAELDIWVLGCGNILVHLDSHQKLLSNWSKRAEQLTQDNRPNRVGWLANFLMQYHLLRGDLKALHALVTTLQNRKDQNSVLFQINLALWSSINKILSAQYKAASEEIRQARKLSEQNPLKSHVPHILGLDIYLALSTQDIKQATKTLEKINSTNFPKNHPNRLYLWHLSSSLPLLQNNLFQAKLAAESTLCQAHKTGLHSYVALAELALAQILIRMGDYTQAFIYLDNVDHSCLCSNRLWIYFVSLISRADGFYLSNNIASARNILSKALTLGKTQNYVNYLPFLTPKSLSRLSAFALEQNIETDYIHFLIAKNQLKPNGNANGHWPWPVKIRTMGNFRIDVGSQPQLHKTKKDNRPLQLLQLLIAINPDGVSRQYLADLLWPDADADAALHAFEVNLQRLRKLLGKQDAVILESGTLRLNRSICWVDYWALDEILRHLDNGISRPLDFTNRLLRIWRGVFLPHLDNAVVLTQRQALKTKFVRCIENLGDELEKSAQHKQAIECYRRAIEAEPLAESIHYRLIETLNLYGRKAEALAAYQHFEVFYKTHVNTTLPATMLELSESIRNV